MGRLAAAAGAARLKGKVTLSLADGSVKTFNDADEAEAFVEDKGLEVNHKRGAFFAERARAKKAPPAKPEQKKAPELKKDEPPKEKVDGK